MNRDHYLSKRQQSFLRMPTAYQSEQRERENDGIMLALLAVPDENRHANAESAAKPKVRSRQ
ncbi:MAG TPA: hypothetical protein DFK12_11210 [Gallionellaceae bacterium]|jgi:hypothetical protein|nr:hypothetical protein [Gallionellaceae bacterium]